MPKLVLTLYGTFSLDELRLKKERELPLPFLEQFNEIEAVIFEAGKCCKTVDRWPNITHCGDTSDSVSRFGYCLEHTTEL